MGNFAVSSAFGGLMPALFNVQLHGFQDATAYGTTPGYPPGFNISNDGGHPRGFQQPVTGGQEADSILKNLLLMICVFVVLPLICW
ncbi:hypothetical protein MLD38_028904 [Melastoma candidum]|nr:hypothetical protein MLD38_028904 [Melastoma candidum]